MAVLSGLLGSKVFWSFIVGLLTDVANAKLGLGAPSGASIVLPGAMSLRTFGKEKS